MPKKRYTPNDLFRRIPFPCHPPSFRPPETLTPDLTLLKGTVHLEFAPPPSTKGDRHGCLPHFL